MSQVGARNVPLVDLRAQFDEIADEVRAGLEDIFARAAFVGGTAVSRFEQAYSDYLGVRHTVGVANGTDALELALRALGVSPGAEVIVPANTFIATAEAVSRAGATPVLVDVDPQHLLIDPDAVRAAVSPRTEVIIPVHLFGQVAPMRELGEVARAYGLAVLEDAAQAQGARQGGQAAGTFGRIAATSFYPGKNLGAAGDAGAVTTDDDELANKVRVISQHGSQHKYDHEAIGFNSRLDAIQAVVLDVKLRRLEAWNERRRELADRYAVALADVAGVVVPQCAEGNLDVWHLYVVQVDDRNTVLERLHKAGVGAGIHYPFPLHLTGAYASLGQARGAFPVAERAAGRICSLPMYPHMTDKDQDYVVEQLAESLS